MSQKTKDAISRSDRVLVGATMIILATASAAIGASMTAGRVEAPKLQPAVQIVHVQDAKPAADIAMTQLLAEHKCLSEVLYYEARGESPVGQKAIAEVVFHRMNHGNYGHSICAVVYEGAKHLGCQFSFACNGEMKKTKQASAWRDAEMLAARIMTGEIPLKNATGGATYFHAVSADPDWADTLERTTQIGNHIFYRGATRSHAS